jgi:TIR domain
MSWMKVFISWSGEVSQQVAVALRDWLPSVIQVISPYVSSEDIDKGARWNTDIAQELEGSSFGILCVTPDNIDAPWVNFEAGALSKSLEQSRVAPFLYGMKRTDVTGPLLQFQSTLYERNDVLKLVRSINAACNDHALEEQRLDDVFDVWWPRLEDQMSAISTSLPTPKSPARSTTDMLNEILELVRFQQGMISDVTMTARNRDAIHPDALRDLSTGWYRIEPILEFHAGSLPQELDEAIAELRGPLEYIARHIEPSTPPRLRRRRPSQADPSA